MLIQGLPIPLLARAVIVVGADDTIKHVEIVPEIATEPNYEPALDGPEGGRRRLSRRPVGAGRAAGVPAVAASVHGSSVIR